MAHYYTCRDCGQKYQIEEPGRYECVCGKVFDVSVNEGKFLIRTIKKQDAPVNELNRKQEPENQPESKNPETAHCPFCHGEIPVGVMKCSHCGEWLTKKPKSKTVYLILTLLFGNLGFGEMYAGRSWLGILLFFLSLAGFISSATSSTFAFRSFVFMIPISLYIISWLLYIHNAPKIEIDYQEKYRKVPFAIRFSYSIAFISLCLSVFIVALSYCFFVASNIEKITKKRMELIINRQKTKHDLRTCDNRIQYSENTWHISCVFLIFSFMFYVIMRIITLSKLKQISRQA